MHWALPGYNAKGEVATMPLTIRAATVADRDIIVEFNCGLARETEGKALDPPTVRAGVSAALTDPRKGPYYLAENDGRVLGQMQVTFEWSDWRNGTFYWIQGVYVRPEARGQGVFRALFQHVGQLARQDPEVIGLRLYVEQENRRAQKVYQGLGMTQTGYLVFEKCPL
jgi:GNAT superfamily N-acetyltransferase